MSGTSKAAADLASLEPLDAEARHLLRLATWIGHFRNEASTSNGSVPSAHWHDAGAAFLVADDRTSRWVQSAADAGLLSREKLLPYPALAWRARRAALTGWAPASANGYFTTSIVESGNLIDTAAGLRANPQAPAGPAHLLAAFAVHTGPAHQKDLTDLAPKGVDALRAYIALWLFEFRDRFSPALDLEPLTQTWFSDASPVAA